MAATLYETVLERLPEGADALVAIAAALGGQASLLTVGPLPMLAPESGLTRLRRRSAWRWPAQARVARRPALQWTGPDEESLTLEGVILPAWRGSASAPEALRALAATGAAHLVIGGDGAAYGRWVIRDLEETRERLYRDGAPRRLSWRLTLARDGSDTPAGRLDALAAATAGAGDVRGMLAAADDALADGGDAAGVVTAARSAAGLAS